MLVTKLRKIFKQKVGYLDLLFVSGKMWLKLSYKIGRENVSNGQETVRNFTLARVRESSPWNICSRKWIHHCWVSVTWQNLACIFVWVDGVIRQLVMITFSPTRVNIQRMETLSTCIAWCFVNKLKYSRHLICSDTSTAIKTCMLPFTWYTQNTNHHLWGENWCTIYKFKLFS